MPKITNIKKTKNKVVFEIDNYRNYEILPSISDEFNLYKNKEIEKEEIKKIIEENKVEINYILCIKRLNRNDYAPSKLYEFLLRKKVNKKIIEKTLDKLRKYGYLNEERIVDSIISYCDSKHYGYKKIFSMMKDKGISEKEIKKHSYDKSREIKEAKLMFNVLQKKAKNKVGLAYKRYIYQGLVRYGFSDEIAATLASNTLNTHKKDITMLKLDYQKAFSSYSRKYKGIEIKQHIIKSLLAKGYEYDDINSLEEIDNEMD